MFFYIDPGTGSMLFTVLIGVLGAVIYALRNVLLKLKTGLRGGRKDAGGEREEIVFFTDSGRYLTTFRPICDELEKRGQKALYLTADEKDPMLGEKYEHIRCAFAGEGNRAYARMNFLKADIVFSSTPGLDVYQWKRSRDVSFYAHIIHACNDVTRYRMFGMDYFDAVLVSGEYQVSQIRQLEKIRNLPEKEIVLSGLPYMDELLKKKQANPRPEEEGTTVLLAPSWGPSGIFRRYGEELIRALAGTGYRLIIRPHPQSMTSEKELIDGLRQKFPEGEGLEWNFDTDNFDALNRADIMISDFSGVMFDFVLVFGKPLIYADVSFDKGPYDAGWLEEELWTLKTLPKIGKQLTPENAGNIGEIIRECLDSAEYAEGREQARKETWVNIGHSAETIAEWLVGKEEKIRAERAAGGAKA